LLQEARPAESAKGLNALNLWRTTPSNHSHKPSSWNRFIRELIAMLTPGANEEMHFLTGPKVGPIRFVSRWARPVVLDRQSPVFVRATAKSVADVLIPIIEQGVELQYHRAQPSRRRPGCNQPLLN